MSAPGRLPPLYGIIVKDRNDHQLGLELLRTNGLGQVIEDLGEIPVPADLLVGVTGYSRSVSDPNSRSIPST
jgi:hypothetical protein